MKENREKGGKETSKPSIAVPSDSASGKSLVSLPPCLLRAKFSANPPLVSLASVAASFFSLHSALVDLDEALFALLWKKYGLLFPVQKKRCSLIEVCFLQLVKSIDV